MATLTVELDDDVLRRVETAAERDHLTVERWVRESLADALAEEDGPAERSPSSEKPFSQHLAEHSGILADSDLEVPSDEDLPPLREIDLDAE